MEKYLLCCDWGTSTFRLRLVETANQRIVGEVVTASGVGVTYNNWKTQLEVKGMERKAFFRQQLKQQIDILSTQVAFSLKGITIVLSGMASSSIGMHEIDYARIPFDVGGRDASIKHFSAQSDFPNDMLLLSGVCSGNDAMRGEETQLIGLMELAGEQFNKDAIFIFPGTHSKHLYVQNRRLTDFRTYMTGEVFNLMASHSILKDSIETDSTGVLSDEKRDAYKVGIQESGSTNILNALFRVRINQLFHTMSKEQNAMYLSGLLIGSELRHLAAETHWQLVLCSGQNLYELYQTAIEELGLSERTITISSGLVDLSAIAGQIKIFKHQKTLNKVNL
jgi:2-dehydro-3-deoxygalactonokinase